MNECWGKDKGMRLNDKVALITGSGSGIGKETAFLFAKEGATVIVNDINKENGEHTAEKIAEQGGTVLFIQADITNELEDRKSTRLNSSHVAISYAVFCLKKKKVRSIQTDWTLRCRRGTA